VIARLLGASLRRRWRQLALIFVAVGAAAASVAAVVGFAARAHAGLAEDLAAFGPNLLVRPQVGAPPTLPAAEVERVRGIAGVTWATGVRESSPDAQRTGDAGEGGVERIEVRADRGRLGEVAAAIEAAVPGAEARPLLRVSESEAALGRRLTALLAALGVLTCLLAAISVGAATTALVDERRAEYGLFLALGFTGRRTAAIFATELLTAALAAALAGDVAGEAAAAALAGRLLTGAATGAAAAPWGTLAASTAAAVLVAGAAMTFALRRVERLEPAQVLRGE